MNKGARSQQDRAQRERRPSRDRSPRRPTPNSERAEARGAVDGGLVGDGDGGGERGRVLAVHVRLRVGGVGRCVGADDGDGLDEGVEVACGLVVGVGPVDEAARPLDRALRGGVDACGPDAVDGSGEGECECAGGRKERAMGRT